MSDDDHRFADVFDPDESDRDSRDRYPPEPRSMPLYSRVVLIIDTVLCGLRGMLVLFGVIGLLFLQQQIQQQQKMTNEQMVLEVVTGAGIVLFGLVGNISLLLKQKWGLWFAWVSVLATICSCAVGVWQATSQFGRFQNNQAEQIGFWIGASFSIIFRGAILVGYVIALWMYSKWMREIETAEVAASHA